MQVRARKASPTRGKGLFLPGTTYPGTALQRPTHGAGNYPAPAPADPMWDGKGWEQLHNGQKSSREKSWEAPSKNRDLAACHPPFQSFQLHQKLSRRARHQLSGAAPAPSVTRQSHCFRSKEKNTLKPQKLGFFEVIISLLHL